MYKLAVQDQFIHTSQAKHNATKAAKTTPSPQQRQRQQQQQKQEQDPDKIDTDSTKSEKSEISASPKNSNISDGCKCNDTSSRRNEK